MFFIGGYSHVISLFANVFLSLAVFKRDVFEGQVPATNHSRYATSSNESAVAWSKRTSIYGPAGTSSLG